MASVSFAGVGKVYRDGTRALSDFDLDVADGEFMVFVGPSGCGKTTALRMVAGLEDITEGEIRIGERRGERAPSAPPGHRDGLPELRALPAHVRLPRTSPSACKVRKTPPEEIKRRVKEAARILGLDHRAEAKARAALRGPAAAGRHGARDRSPPAGLPDGRAAVEPRREAPRADAGRDRSHPAGARRDDDLRHARPGGGDDDGRPRRSVAEGTSSSRSTRRRRSTTGRPTSSSRASSAARR